MRTGKAVLRPKRWYWTKDLPTLYAMNTAAAVVVLRPTYSMSEIACHVQALSSASYHGVPLLTLHASLNWPVEALTVRHESGVVISKSPSLTLSKINDAGL